MNTEECLKLLRQVKDVAFATVDGFGNPQVRIIDVMHVDGEKLYFLTARGKDFYRELITTNNVSICGLTKDYQSISVQGEIKRLENQKEWVDKIFVQNPAMNAVYPKESRYVLEVFFIEKGEVE